MREKRHTKKLAQGGIFSINTNKGLLSDIVKWTNLYKEDLLKRNKNNEISHNTFRSYLFTIKNLVQFVVREYDTDESISEVNESFFNDYLEWVSDYSHNISYGTSEYIEDSIVDLMQYHTKMQSEDLFDSLNDYLSTLNNEYDYASLSNILNTFASFCDEKALLYDSDTQIKSFIDTIQNKEHMKIKTSSLKQRKAAMTAFFSFVSLKNNEKVDLTKDFKYIRKIRDNNKSSLKNTHKKGYSKGEMKLVDKTIREHYRSKQDSAKTKEYSKYCSLRDATLGLLMMYAGLRADEVINLKFSNITLENNTYLVVVENGKGGKSRTTNAFAPLLEKEIELLKAYGYEHLSATRGGKKTSYNALWKSIKKILSDVEINYTGLHSFRHTFASEIAKCGDVVLVAELLGHSDLKTTQIYINIHNDRKSETVASLQSEYLVS